MKVTSNDKAEEKSVNTNDHIAEWMELCYQVGNSKKKMLGLVLPLHADDGFPN